ncbi:uncharacterized, partial [Tachysurus ichikawai]
FKWNSLKRLNRTSVIMTVSECRSQKKLVEQEQNTSSTC